MSLGRLPQLILSISHDARTGASSRADTLQSSVKVTKTVMMKYSGQNEGSADLVITPHHESEGLISFHGRPGQVSVSQKLVTAISLVTLHSPVLHQRRVSRNEHGRFLALCLVFLHETFYPRFHNIIRVLFAFLSP